MSTAAKAVMVVVASIFTLIGGAYGTLNMTDWRYFLRAEAQGLERAVEQQRVDALYRDIDDLQLRAQRRALNSTEKKLLERAKREIERLERREKK